MTKDEILEFMSQFNIFITKEKSDWNIYISNKARKKYFLYNHEDWFKVVNNGKEIITNNLEEAVKLYLEN